MKMDIACPVELIGFEQVEFSEGRKQAYLTFLNEAEEVVVALSGRLTLYGDDGSPVHEERVAFGNVLAEPGVRFVCHMPLDDYPSFLTVSMLVEDVVFDGVDAWALHPMRLKDYDPPIVEDGPARRALTAVVGEDAICYPENRGSLWVCACGRFNRWRWLECRRCGRERDRMLALTPEMIMTAYSKKQDLTGADEAARAARPGVSRQVKPMDTDAYGERGEASQRAARTKTRKRTPKEKVAIGGERERKNWLLTLALPIVVVLMFVAGLAWGASTLSSRLEDIHNSGAQTSGVTMDYLEPL